MKEQGSAGERDSYLARTGPSGPRPFIPARPGRARPPPGTRASMPSPRPAPRPRPGRGATTAGRRRARATWRLTSPGRATPSTEVCSNGSWESGGTGREARGAAAAGLGPRAGRPRGQSRGLRGLLSRDLSCGLHQAPRSASPSGTGAKAHVWFCFSEGEGAPGG